ncbi:hypothetical protein VNO80_19466 [Phaseolus coccineus]|uniref:Uncharacterized protein n=1 Tax=Phaseolus coccineus TaxID=3886 RepID=A0AAN9MG32_PHACN
MHTKASLDRGWAETDAIRDNAHNIASSQGIQYCHRYQDPTRKIISLPSKGVAIYRGFLIVKTSVKHLEKYWNMTIQTQIELKARNRMLVFWEPPNSGKSHSTQHIGRLEQCTGLPTMRRWSQKLRLSNGAGRNRECIPEFRGLGMRASCRVFGFYFRRTD